MCLVRQDAKLSSFVSAIFDFLAVQPTAQYVTLSLTDSLTDSLTERHFENTTTERPWRLVKFETFDQSDEET